MSSDSTKTNLSRRDMFGAVGKAVTAAAMTPLIQTAIVSCAKAADEAPLNTVAGVDRVTILPGKTYIRGWAGYGEPPRPAQGRSPQPATPTEVGPPPSL